MTSDEGNSWSPHPRCLCPLFVSSPPLPSCSACSSTCSCPSHWPHSCCRSEVIVSPDCTERSLSSWSSGFAALSICLQLPSCQHDNIERHLVSSPEHQALLFLSTVLRQSLAFIEKYWSSLLVFLWQEHLATLFRWQGGLCGTAANNGELLTAGAGGQALKHHRCK